MAQSTVRLIVDAQNAIRSLQRTNDATKELSKNTNNLKNKINEGKNSLDKFGNAGKGASSKVNTLTGTLKKLAAAFAVIKTAQFIFFNAAEIETQRKSLEVLTGSLSKTNKIIQELQDFGAVTPFKSSELIEQTKRLKAFGFETEELVDSTKRLANVAGATGADLQGIATAFGQIRAKGKLQREEELQLLERGVDITTELKRITGLQGEEFESAMRKGKIGADLVNQALINLTSEGGAFFGGATKQATTLNGKLSTLIDSVESLARTIGEQLSPAIKAALDFATQGVVAIEKIFKRFGNIGNIGLGKFAKAEQDARRDAAKLTATRFGTNFKGESLFASQEENEFFKEQFDLLVKQNIEREKLKQKTFEEVEIIEEVNQNSSETVSIVETLNNGLVAEVGLLEKGSAAMFVQNEQADKLKQKFNEIGQSVENNLVQNLTDAVMGAKSLGDALSSVLKGLQRQLIEMAMQNAVSGLGSFISKGLGAIFGGGGGGSVIPIGSVTESVLGTKFDKSLMLSGVEFANGGKPPVGKASLVGEKGPELFVPQKSGTIIPNHALGGTTNVVVNVDASSTSAQGDDQSATALGEVIAAAVQAEIAKQQMDGGLLS